MRYFTILSLCLYLGNISKAYSQDNLTKQLRELDKRFEQIIKDWSVSGCAIGIVKGDKLIYAKGFGYRDLENKLPVTPETLFLIGSNTKLFTATALGIAVNEGQLDWDIPIKKLVPQIEFPNSTLNELVTLRDMASHRTGLNPHDGLWSRTNFNQKEIFDRIQFMKPEISFRENYLYNNVMYIATGYILEIKTGKSWEEYIQEKILLPLGMKNTHFSLNEMQKSSNYAKPYQSDIITKSVAQVPFHKRTDATGPAGAISSNLLDLSNWVICQLSNGKFTDKQVIPTTVINETLKPHTFSDWYITDDKEVSQGIYGLGRITASYKGHFISEHGGHIDGFLSQLTIFPNDNLGIIVLTNSTGHELHGFLEMEIADKILNLDKTQWHERNLDRVKKNKMQQREVALKYEEHHVHSILNPSFDLINYAGVYTNPMYGKVVISYNDNILNCTINNVFSNQLIHLNHDLFEMVDSNKKFKLLFQSDFNGKIGKLIIPFDGFEIEFLKNE